MYTRIRYLKKDHLLVTKEAYLAKDKIICAEIDTSTMSFKVFETNKDTRGDVLVGGASKTLILAKKLVKETFKGLGVQFDDEVRNKESRSLTGPFSGDDQ